MRPTHSDAPEMADHWWWRPGWGPGTRAYAWHLTFHGQHQLHQLVDAYQGPLGEIPTLDLIPRPWLHLTLQGLGQVPDVDDTDRDAVLAAAGRRLAALPPPTLTFHRPVIFSEGVVLTPVDPEPAHAIRTALREAIAEVRGAERVPDRPDDFHPHLTIAYSNAAGDPTPIRSTLDTVRVDPVDVQLSHASLIVLNRDHRMYQWTEERRVDLGQAPPRTGDAI